MNYRNEKLYMISCNELTVSSCSTSCPVPVERTWYRLLVLNWILYYDMKFLGWLLVYWAVWRSHILKWAHLIYFLKSLCCVKGGSAKICQFHSCLCYFWWTHTCGCQQFTVIHVLYVYKARLTDVTHLLVLLLQYLTRYTVCRCFWEQADVDWYMDFRYKMSVFFSNASQHGENCNFTSFVLYISVHSETVVCCPVLFCSFFCICTCFIILSVNCWLL